MKRLLTLVVLLLALRAEARVPCSPVLIADPQGRPIPNAVFTVSTMAGVHVDVFVNATDSTFLTAIPPNQMLQFWATDPGIYLVNMSGSGVVKVYYAVCGEGYGAAQKLVAVDRNAENMLFYSTVNPPVVPSLVCNNGAPCAIQFTQQSISCVQIDWIMPSFALTFGSYNVSYIPVQANVATNWFVKDCVYKVGESPCDIWAGNLTNVADPTPQVGKRNDFTVPVVSTWAPLDHVVTITCYDGSNDQWPAPSLENIRIEFSR